MTHTKITIQINKVSRAGSRLQVRKVFGMERELYHIFYAVVPGTPLKTEEGIMTLTFCVTYCLIYT